MKKLLLTVFAVFLLLSTTWAQSGNSNIGTEFYTAWSDHVDASSGMLLYIASDVSTKGTVAFTDGTASISFAVIPNVVTQVSIPSSQFLGDYSGISQHGIHITSVSPIAVYAHIYNNNVSGATLLLPVNTLANDYYSLNYKQLSNSTNPKNENKPSYSVFMFVAIEDNTTVEITPSADLLPDALGAHPANTKYQIVLSKGQVYQGLSNSDLTGTHIVSVSSSTGGCKKIAMFSGSSKIYIGSPGTSADNLFQQVYPTASWGKSYIIVPLKVDSYDVIRVVVSDPTTVVKVNGSPITSAPISSSLVTAGTAYYYEFNNTATLNGAVNTNVITADKPIQVVQYAVTQGNTISGVSNKAVVGDPEMIFINPLEQTIDHVTLYSATKAEIVQSYINVVIPTAAVSSFLLDGSAPGGFATVGGNPAYSYGQFSVSSGATHVISASQGFNAIAYGFGSYESYGYAAGTNVKNLNEYVQYTNPATKQVETSGCTGVPIIPEVIIPYQTTSISWDLGNGSPVTTQNSPTPINSFIKNGVTLYTYDYNSTVTYSPGAYAVKATVVDPITTVCGSTEEIDLNFNVSDPPTSKFASRNSICYNDTIGFTDQSLVNGGAIKSWAWDFGSNGATSNLQNPVYQYAAPGDYTVSLTVTGVSGCQDVYAKTVHVGAPSVASFTPTTDCEAMGLIFTDNSVPVDGKITKWIWDYGDGTPVETRTDNLPFAHVYTTAGAYTVKLQIFTDNQCFSATTSRLVTVNPLPVADFVLPDVCISDAGAVFNAVPDNNAQTYLWDFGDTGPNNNVSGSNPNTVSGLTVHHHYNIAGNYSVKLTVITTAGCSADVTKQIRVNGSTPVADFSVQNPNSLCSTSPVLFTNNASIPGFGDQVTSVDIYYDVNNPATKVHYERPASGQVFSYQYPIENITTHPYTVRMIAYSGETCISEPKDILINVLPVAALTFNPLPDVCQDGGTIDLRNYVSSSINTGSGIFYLDGTTNVQGDIFNPKNVATGTHSIYYTYQAGSCSATIKQTITVAPVPTVDAGPGKEVVAGESVTLQASSYPTTGVKYLWTPATGLNDPTVLNPVCTPTTDMHYTLTATLTSGIVSCPISDTITVRVLHLPVPPNTFTPNGDGINDLWEVKYLSQYTNCTVKIFNRAGGLVYSSNSGYDNPWNGTMNNNGVQLPVGTYYYIIDPKHNLKLLSGSVNIIR